MTVPAVFYAAPALEVKYLAPVPLACAALVAAETVGFGSFPVEPIVLDDDSCCFCERHVHSATIYVGAALPRATPL